MVASLARGPSLPSQPPATPNPRAKAASTNMTTECLATGASNRMMASRSRMMSYRSPHLFLRDGLRAIQHRRLAVLEQVDFSREVHRVDVGQARDKLRGMVGAHASASAS